MGLVEMIFQGVYLVFRISMISLSGSVGRLLACLSLPSLVIRYFLFNYISFPSFID